MFILFVQSCMTSAASSYYDDVRLLDDYDNERGSRENRRARSGSKKRRSKSRVKPKQPPKPEPTKCIITVMYAGKSVHIPYDTQVFGSKDRITVYQQHCGGENLMVYHGMHEAGEKFQFVSKRHKEYPFGLSFYVDNIFDCRVSTCCEYRHKPETKIGGHFKVASITGAYPCLK